MKKRSLINNTLSKIRYFKWSLNVAFFYFIKGVARELNIAPIFFSDLFLNRFLKKWRIKENGQFIFNFCGAKLPDISTNRGMLNNLLSVFDDTFLFPCVFKDKYDKVLVEFMDSYMLEGPYGYTDGKFDVTVKKYDVVVDAGAWIGDFSAYAASKDAIVYAFEPVGDTFNWLCKTQALNGAKINPVRKGLSNFEGRVNISLSENSDAHSTVLKRGCTDEEIEIISLDKFVADNRISRIDFIKADIEGAERDMLRGATNVLKTFAPKLAICTYHLPDDPEILENIIIEANPDYTVVHLKSKLFAAVINEFK
ncbi:MAG: FkbM family methyltransferase [Prevotellaceae bacterium]|jgi:FkbM family methyltransferase|nr:FkbM family methyltransferase [Prevotellaceae bacterium]